MTFLHFKQLRKIAVDAYKGCVFTADKFSWCTRELVANCFNGISLHVVAVCRILTMLAQYLLCLLFVW